MLVIVLQPDFLFKSSLAYFVGAVLYVIEDAKQNYAASIPFMMLQ